MDNTIQEYIQCLKNFNEQLDKLTEIRRKFQPDFSVAVDYTFIFDSRYRYLYFSAAGAKYLGVNPADAEGKHWREVGFAELVPNFETELQTVFATGKEVKGKTQGLPTVQGVKYFEYTITPIYTTAKVIEAVVCIAKDITTKILNRTLYNQTMKFNHFIEICPLPIVIIDTQSRIIAANQAYADNLSMDKSELTGKAVSLFAGQLGLRHEQLSLIKALDGLETRQQFRLSSRGEFFETCFPLRDEVTGEIIGAIGVFTDITDYGKLLKEMGRLDRLNLVGEMAAGVAHEIRNPMTVAKGYLQFLRRKVPQSMAEQFDLILSEIGRIEQLITDFISLARDKPTEVKLQNLNAIVEEMAPLIETHAIKQDVELRMQLGESLPYLLIDENEIKQLLLNLARNGIEAMTKHGILTIKTGTDRQGVYLQVADTGCGIEQKYREKIFDPFFSLKDNGTGLGLAVSAGIVRRHNGRIFLETEPGKGACFRIQFPVCSLQKQ